MFCKFQKSTSIAKGVHKYINLNISLKIVCLMFAGAVLAAEETTKIKRAYPLGYGYEPYNSYRFPGNNIKKDFFYKT